MNQLTLKWDDKSGRCADILATEYGICRGQVLDSVLESLGILFDSDASAAAALRTQPCRSLFGITESLSRMVAARVQLELLQHTPFVGISYAYKQHVDRIAEQLSQSGIPSYLCSQWPSVTSTHPTPMVPIPLWTARYLPNLRVFLCIHNTPAPVPTGTARVHLPHALVLHETERALVDWWWRAFPSYDYFFLADNIAEIESAAGAQEIRDAMNWYAVNSPVSHRCGWYRDHASQHVTLCAAGYPSIEMMRQASLGAEPENAVVYAPRSMTAGGVPPNAALDLIGEELVAALLTQFSDIRVLFRPYPADRNTPCVRQIIARFHTHPRFEFDSGSLSWGVLARTKVLVTDNSHIKFTYAYGALRPAVSFEANAPEVSGASSGMRRTPFGYSVRSVEHAVSAVAEALSTSTAWPDKLAVARDRVLARPTSASARIVELLADLYHGRPVCGRRIALPPPRMLRASEVAEVLGSPLTQSLSWETSASMAEPLLRQFPGNELVEAASRALFARYGVVGPLL